MKKLLLLPVVLATTILSHAQNDSLGNVENKLMAFNRVVKKIVNGKINITDQDALEAYTAAKELLEQPVIANDPGKAKFKNVLDSFEAFKHGKISTSKNLVIAINRNRACDLKFFVNKNNIANMQVDDLPILLYALQHKCSKDVIHYIIETAKERDSIINQYLAFPGDYKMYYLSPLTKACINGDTDVVNKMIDANARFYPDGLTGSDQRWQSRFLWAQFANNEEVCKLITRRMPDFPNPEMEKRDLASAIEADMVLVEGATFTMGCQGTEGECLDAWPPVDVPVKSFYISKFETTQNIWNAMLENDNPTGSCDECPIERVSWQQVQKFIGILNQYSKKKFRLPTEPEWEFAAKGGKKSKHFIYSGSNNIDSVGWIKTNCTGMQTVGQKQPNELGIYDMSGNVAEWCGNAYSNNLDAFRYDPNGISDGTKKSIRGGACTKSEYSAQVVKRNKDMEDYSIPFCGFRLVYDAD